MSSPVFLIESDLEDQEFFRAALEMLYPEVHLELFASGHALLDFLKNYSEGHIPACIVLAFKLPDLSGPGILQALGFLERYKVVPKVVWSEVAMDREVAECLSLGADRFVIKPCTFDEMKALIHSIYKDLIEPGSSANISTESQAAS